MCISFDKTFYLVPSSSSKVKVKYPGHIPKKKKKGQFLGHILLSAAGFSHILTISSKCTHFNTLKKKAFGKQSEKRCSCLK